MRRTTLALLATATWIALPAHAVFKCTIDGKTTYQERPCDDDVRKKGGESKLAQPSRRGDLITPEVTSKAENERRRGLSKSDSEPLARSAFAALKEGRMTEYREMACIGARRAMNNPNYVNGLKTEGQDYTKRKVELGKAESSDELGATFLASEVKDPSKTWHKPAEQLYVRINIQWEDAKPCIGNIQTYAKAAAR